MNNFPVEEIPPLSYFTKAVYIDPQFIVAAPEMPFTESLAKAITEWGFTEVHSEGEPKESYLPNGIGNGIDSITGSRQTIADLDKLQQAERFYASFQHYIASLFSQVSIKGTVNFGSVAENIKPACEFVRDGRKFLMRAERHIEPARIEDYLAFHTARSTVIAIIIGLHLKLPSHRLIELGAAAIFHEIGMIKLPPSSYLSSRPLTEQEQKLMYSHPIIGYNLLRSMNFPLAVSRVALEHHERENGSGYPQQLTGNQISPYSKIIAVACSYEAISSRRPHREAKDGYTGMLELLKNEGKQYDDDAVKALVLSLSIYPIGLYVLLSSGKRGQVVDVDPDNPRYPVVQIFGELVPSGKNKVMQTSADGLHIVRPLTREELEGR